MNVVCVCPRIRGIISLFFRGRHLRSHGLRLLSSSLFAVDLGICSPLISPCRVSLRLLLPSFTELGIGVVTHPKSLSKGTNVFLNYLYSLQLKYHNNVQTRDRTDTIYCRWFSVYQTDDIANVVLNLKYHRSLVQANFMYSIFHVRNVNILFILTLLLSAPTLRRALVAPFDRPFVRLQLALSHLCALLVRPAPEVRRFSYLMVGKYTIIIVNATIYNRSGESLRTKVPSNSIEAKKFCSSLYIHISSSRCPLYLESFRG